MDTLALLAIAMGGDTEDAIDLSKGAKKIPGIVTEMRRKGKYVNYIPGNGEFEDKWVDIDGNTVA